MSTADAIAVFIAVLVISTTSLWFRRSSIKASKRIDTSMDVIVSITHQIESERDDYRRIINSVPDGTPLWWSRCKKCDRVCASKEKSEQPECDRCRREITE